MEDDRFDQAVVVHGSDEEFVDLIEVLSAEAVIGSKLIVCLMKLVEIETN